MKRLSLAFVVCAILFCSIDFARGQAWTQTRAPITNWTSIASSANGSKLVAVAGQKRYDVQVGPIYFSTNFGTTWLQADAPITNWTSVAISADGTKVVAAANGTGIYTSPDGGANWTPTTAPVAPWYAIASSADGSMLLAAVGGIGFPYGPSAAGPVFISSDSGANWSDAGLPTHTWSSVGVSADGSSLMAASPGGGGVDVIFSSTNSGATWIARSFPLPYLFSITTCADGTSSLAVQFDWVHYQLNHNGSRIYSSTDNGALWEEIGSLGPAPVFLAASADGRQWVAANQGGPGENAGGISISRDSGINWLATAAPMTNWSSVASSADGNRLVAAVNGGGIWISETTSMPRLNLSRRGTNLLVAWLLPSTDFGLEEKADLNATNWMEVTSAPALNLNHLQNQVTLPQPVGNRFYRLRH